MTASFAISSSDVVQALYQTLLLREGDVIGLAEKTNRLDDGRASIGEIISEIIASQEFGAGLPELLNFYGHGSSLKFTNEVSQYGEVMELLKIMSFDAVASPVLVDVGARGRDRSNSYDLLKHFNWSGILIEANSALVDQIACDFSGLAQKCVCCAVSDYDGVASLTLGVNPDVSSLNAGLALHWGPSPGSIEVPVRRLASILTEHEIPHLFGLLSLDIEGEDIKVLNDLIEASPYRPKYVIIEASDNFRVQHLDDAPFSDAVKKAYDISSRTKANLILRRRSENG